MITRRSLSSAVLATAIVASCAACSTSLQAAGGHGSAARSTPPISTISTLPASTPARTTPPAPTRIAPTGTPSPKKTQPTSQLPHGGRTILPRYRVVAFYGAAGTPALGVLGQAAPDVQAAAIERQAAAYARFGRPVQPAMELLASVAQRGPGPDGTYSKPVPDAVIARYLAAAHRQRMLLILDVQPGRGTFLAQVRRLAPFLGDPWVQVAVDPEWKMGPHQVPGTVIGSSTAADINAVARYLAGIISARHLPDKLLLVHQFRPAMLPDREHIVAPRGIELVLHADGFGSVTEKRASYARLAIPSAQLHAGFKLFYRQDKPVMSPAQVMALHPQPEVITYQ